MVLLIVGGIVVGAAAYLFQSPRVIDAIVERDTPSKSGLRITDWGAIVKGQLRVEVPDEVWQKEVAALFPITEEVAGFVKLDLRDPRFVADADPTWLRMELGLTAQVLNVSNESFPGRAVLRTRLKLDPAGRAVLLDQAQLAEFSFTGEAGRMVSAIQGVLAEAFADELADFQVFEIPKDGGWLQQQSVNLLSDIAIERNKVVVVLGR